MKHTSIFKVTWMKKMTSSFVPRGTISCIDARSKPSHKEQHKRGVACFKDLKSRSRCFNCGKKGEHWSSDFREPPKRNKDKHAALDSQALAQELRMH